MWPASRATVSGEVVLWNLVVKEGILSRLEKAECERVLRKKILKQKAKALASFNGVVKGDDVPQLDGSLGRCDVG